MQGGLQQYRHRLRLQIRASPVSTCGVFSPLNYLRKQ